MAEKKKKADKDEFENIAETLECDTSDEALDKVFDNLDMKAKEEKEQSKK